MNRTAAIIAIILLAGIGVGAFLLFKGKNRPVGVTVRVLVSPKEQMDFAAGKANSAMFKYLVGSKSGVKPVLAQKMEIKPVQGTAMLEAKVGAMTAEDGQKYADSFAQVLQDLCGTNAQITLADKKIR